jgi:hypothetical protein
MRAFLSGDGKSRKRASGAHRTIMRLQTDVRIPKTATGHGDSGILGVDRDRGFEVYGFRFAA